MTETPENLPNGNVIVICITTLFIFVLASCVGVFIAAPEGANTESLITLLLGSLAPTVGVLTLLVKGSKQDNALERVETKADRILNGEMEGKIRAALVHVLEERLTEKESQGNG